MWEEIFKNFQFSNAFSNFLDISIVSFLLYRILLLLSRTRAFQLLLGILLVIVTDVFARYFNLITLNWIITNISTYLVIGIIVLMQPELRRLTLKLGEGKLLRWFSASQKIDLDEILKASRNMASHRIGSLIVILRNIRPQSIIDNAVPVNSDITSQLIETIFTPPSPLHDGAIIIEGKKILAASCYLPLSSHSELKSTFGARHRSALGISEETDAITIITSEESGRISITYQGEIITPRLSELKSCIARIIEIGEVKKEI